MMSIARGGHGEISTGRIRQGPIIEILPCGGVEDFNCLEIQGIENILGNSRSPVIVRMRGNGHSAPVFDRPKDVRCRLSAHVGKQGADTKEVAFRRRNLNPRNNEKSVCRETVRSFKFVFDEVLMDIACVVIRYRDTAQASRSRRLDQLLRAAGCIRRKERMDVKVKSMNHEPNLFPFDENALSKLNYSCYARRFQRMGYHM
jgi:hypothetical protein